MGIDPGKLNQIPTKSLRAACPKDNILFLLHPDTGAEVLNTCIYVVVNFLFQLIFIFPLFWGMVMYANEYKTKEKQKLTEIKN